MTLRLYKHVHCIGIGGIGLSALARYCKKGGADVTGSDTQSSRITEDLEKEGIMVYLGHNRSHLSPKTDLVLYTIAVPETNPELAEAKRHGITCLTYPEALGLLTKEYTTIAVCGTHGKTTTTAMIAEMLKSCGKNPTVIVGSLLKNGGTNYIQGDGEYLVVEACEYRRSFLNLSPTYIVVTNIDEDHLDYYKDLNDIESAFQSFADKLTENGDLITHSGTVLHTNVRMVDADTATPGDISLSVLGKHNVENARLALTLAKVLSLPEDTARAGVKAFSGTWRRLEYRGEYKGKILYDDYGHHPKEIQATLQALRERYKEDEYTLITIFQPHLFSRTKLFLNEFATAFSSSDITYILPIYASREVDDGSISSRDLVEKMHGAVHVETFAEVKEYLDGSATANTVVLTIGAGDVYRIHDMLKV